MKKALAIALAILCCLTTLSVAVSAQDGLLSVSVTGSDQNQLIAAWQGNALPDGATVEFEEALIGGVSCPISESNNTVIADVSELPVGIYTTVTYSYTVNEDEGSVTVNYRLVKTGSLAVTLSMDFDGEGFVTVKATDANGKPVAGYALEAVIGDVVLPEVETDENGIYRSRYFAEYGSTASCKGKGLITTDGVVYLGTETVEKTRALPTTTTVTTTTTTTESTVETTTTVLDGTTTSADGTVTTTTTVPVTTTTTAKPVNATTTNPNGGRVTIKGAGTTSYSDGKVAINVSLETNILTLFGLKDKDFANNARLFLTETDYKNLVGRTSDVLMLNVLTSEKQATAADVAAAIANVSEFSTYDEEHREAVTFDLSFLKLDSSGKVVPITAVPLNSTYVVQLPIPEQMRNCKKLAITMFSGDSLMTPVRVDVQNQCIRLEINSLEPYTLIGFRDGDGQQAGGNSTLLVVLLIVGILLLLGAATLMYLFVLRKPDAKVTDTEPILTQPQTFDENDIFSGREDFNEINRRPPSDDNE